jgi:DNA repair ATPase RecN
MSGYAGMQWFKCDFQVQTPEDATHWNEPATSLKEPRTQGDLQEKARLYLKRCHEVGLQVIGVTDHNFSARTDFRDWFLTHLVEQNNSVAEELGKSPIAIFPGFEVDIGYHLLCLFDPVKKSKDLSRVSDVLSALGLVTSQRFDGGRPKPLRKESAAVHLRTVLHEVQKNSGGLVIGAHAFSKDGICNASSHIPDFLNEELVCVEVPKAELSHREKQILKGNEPQWLRESGRQPAYVRSSDAKSLCPKDGEKDPSNYIGYRHTWVKMSEPSIEALRQACMDSESRISIGVESPATQLRHPRIVALEVKNAAFVDDQCIQFSPGLNCLIGGRGSGKSSLLEYLRFALEIERSSSLPPDIKQKLVSLYGTIDGPEAELRVTFESDMGVSDTVVLRPRLKNHTLDGREVFDLKAVIDQLQIQFFSQGELSRLTRPGENQVLRVVDASCGEPLQALINQEVTLKAELEQLSYSAHRATVVATEVNRLRQVVVELERQWKAHQDIQVEVAEHQKVLEVMSFSEKTLADAKAQANRVALLIGPPGPAPLWPEKSEEKWPDPKWFVEVNAIVEAADDELRKDLEAATAKYLDRIQGAFGENQRWRAIQAEIAKVEERFHAACKAKGLHPADIHKLEQVDASWRQKTKELESLVREHEKLVVSFNTRVKKLEELKEIWRKQFEIRVKACAEIQEKSHSTKVSIGYMSDKTSFARHWSRLQPKDARVKLSKTWDDIGDEIFIQYLAAKPASPWDVLERWLEQGDCPKSVPIDDVRRHLESGEMRQTWDSVKLSRVDDEVEVKLHRQDGTVAGTMSGAEGQLLSEGQRNTALLNLMLAQGSGPIVIDQPEDELDSNYIFTALVPLIREVKGHRQLIVATHNANLPVNADAELIYAMEARDAKGKCRVQGGLDREPVTQAVLDVLEGSEKAFKLRSDKYRF